MKIGKVIMGMALIVLGILLISMFWQVIGAKTASKVIEDDYDVANMNFKSYNAGDTVLIKDEIKDITYVNTTKSTIIVFEGKNGDVSFLFKGELHPFLGEYKKGDTVLIILKVEKKNNIEWFEGSFDANFTGFSSDKIHKLYLGGNAFFCVIILIGVLMLIYGLLKKKTKPVYYPPPAYPTQPVYPQPPPQYPPPQYQQQPQQQYPSYQQPPTPQIQFQPAKKGLFQRLKKLGR